MLASKEQTDSASSGKVQWSRTQRAREPSVDTASSASSVEEDKIGEKR